MGRRWNLDPKPTVGISDYACFVNNPILFNDIKGDSAWKVSNQWNKKYVNQYNKFVGDAAKKYAEAGRKFTCEDFALTTAMDFAKQNELPFKFTNGTGTYDATSNSYSDYETFKNDVLKTSAAPDLQNSQNSTPVATGKVTAGTIILNRNASNRATHVQMVYSVKENDPLMGTKAFNIVQGNSGHLNWIPGGGRLGGGDPTSWMYTGTPLEKGVYLPNSDHYWNMTTDASYDNFSKVRNVEFRQFNFMNMNFVK